MPKSLSVERTFREDINDFETVQKEAMDAASELIRRVRSGRFTFRVAGVKIRFRGFETHTRERSLVGRTDSEDSLQDAVAYLLNEFEKEHRPVRLIGVRVADLSRADTEPLSLDVWASP